MVVVVIFLDELLVLQNFQGVIACILMKTLDLSTLDSVQLTPTIEDKSVYNEFFLYLKIFMRRKVC